MFIFRYMMSKVFCLTDSSILFVADYGFVCVDVWLGIILAYPTVKIKSAEMIWLTRGNT